MNVKLKIGFFTKDGQPMFTEKVTTVLELMDDNPNYVTPSPTLAVVTTAFDAYKVATANAAQGGKENTAIRNARRAELVAFLRQLANYVSSTANGDLEMLMSSGFPVQKTVRTPIGPLSAPAAPKVIPGPVTGSMRAIVPPIYGALIYNWRLALASAPTVYVQTTQTGGGRVLFQGLTPGLTYIVQANVVGTAGTTDWGETGTMMVV